MLPELNEGGNKISDGYLIWWGMRNSLFELTSSYVFTVGEVVLVKLCRAILAYFGGFIDEICEISIILATEVF